MLEQRYGKYYCSKPSTNLYPTEFVVRYFLGSYPNLQNKNQSYPGQTILDIGCGDGRNIPFLSALGFNVHGLDISQEIIDKCHHNLTYNKAAAFLNVGSNSKAPYSSSFFDYILGCHSLYYVQQGDSFKANLKEMHRLLKPSSCLLFSVPMASSYLLRSSIDAGNNHAVITSDPLNIRNGEIIKYYNNIEEIEQDLQTAFFSEIQVASCCNNWWGIEEHCWLVSCRKVNVHQ